MNENNLKEVDEFIGKNKIENLAIINKKEETIQKN